MTKVNQVTNEDERQLMQGRIIKAALMIESMPNGEEKTKYLKAYDEMVSLLLAYNRAQYVKTYPGVRAIYEKLGWVVAESTSESRDSYTHHVIESNVTASKSNGESQNEGPTAPDNDNSGADWF